MTKKLSKSGRRDLIDTHVYLNQKDWEMTQKLAKKKDLNGSDLLRRWMRECLEREKGTI
jgi:hypothetical protein